MSSYLTQFPQKQRIYQSATHRIAAQAKRALGRKLLLPSAEGNWMAMFELLNSKRLKPGVSPSHYQQWLRTVVSQSPTEIDAIHWCRDSVVGGNIVASSSLWITIIWAYCQRGKVDEAMEVARLATVRAASITEGSSGKRGREVQKHTPSEPVTLSPSDQRHIATLLLPLLSEMGRHADFEHVANSFLPTQQDKISSEVLTMKAEAFARGGKWREALDLCGSLAFRNHNSSGGGSAAPSMATYSELDRLFQPRDEDCMATSDGAVRKPAERGRNDENEEDGRTTTLAVVKRSSESLSAEGFRQLAIAAGMDLCWEVALHSFNIIVAREETERNEESFTDVVCSTLNALGSAQQWDEAKEVFHFYQRRATSSLDPLVVDLFFSCCPSVAVGSSSHCSANVTYRHVEKPGEVVHEFDALLQRDDYLPTNSQLLVVCSALFQLEEHDRCCELLSQSSLIRSFTRVGRRRNTEIILSTERQLVHLVYLLSAVDTRMKLITMTKFPHIFPKEAFAGMPAREDVDGVIAQQQREKEQRVPTSARITRRRYFGERDWFSDFERRMQRIQLAPKAHFEGKDPNADPRLAPLDYLDEASGWRYFAKGGNRFFEGTKWIGSPLSAWPKVMHGLRNPYRSWSPLKSSVHAHSRRPVRSWNGNSSL